MGPTKIFLLLLLLHFNHVVVTQDAQLVDDDVDQLGTVEYLDENEREYQSMLPDVIGLPSTSEKKVVFDQSNNHSSGDQVFGFPDQSAKLIKSNCSIMMISSNNLYSFNVSADVNIGGFYRIGILGDIGEEHIVDVQFISINEFTLLLVALNTRYNVYVTANNNEFNGTMYPIEKLALYGQHLSSILFVQGDTMYALIGNGVPNELGALTSTIRIFKWRQSHFTLLDRHSFNWMKDIHQCGTSDDTTVFVVVRTNEEASSSNTLLEVFLFGQDRWRHVQNLQVGNSVKVFTFNMDNQCYLMISPNGALAEKYVWEVDNFRPVIEHQSITFEYLVSNNYDMVLTLNRDTLMAYTEVDFTNAYTLESKSFSNSSDMFLIESNERLLVGIVTVTRNTSYSEYQVILIGIHIEQVDRSPGEVGNSLSGENVKSCFSDLDKVVNERKTLIDKLRSIASSVIRLDEALNSSTIEFHANSSKMVSGTFLKIQTDLSAIHIKPPSQLLKEIQNLKQRLEIFKMRAKRDTLTASTVNQWDSVVVKRLWVNNDQFKNILRRDQQMRLQVPVTANKLNANSIKLQQTTDENVKSTSSSKIGRKLRTDGIKRVDRLRVRTINGIEWDAFVNLLYLKNTPKPIKGNLLIVRPTIVTNMIADTLNGMPVNTLLTQSTDQVIESTFHVLRMESNGLNATHINGIQFDNEVATTKGETFIETPVTIEKCTVDALTLSGDEPDEISRHVVGTQLEDLSQIYTGRVTIRGSVRFNNIIVDRENTVPSVNINDELFDLHFKPRYWTKSTDQNFGPTHFDAPTFVSRVSTESINKHPADAYILCSVNPQNVNLFMHSVNVTGNVYTDPSFRTALSVLSENAVRRQDSVVIETGKKLFTGILSTESLNTMAGPNNYAELNGLLHEQLFTGRKKIVLPCTKQFQQLTVFGNVHVTSEQLGIVVLNGINLINTVQNMASINEKIKLDEVHFLHNVNSANFAAQVVDGLPFSSVIDQLESIVGNRGSIGAVRINGDATFNGNLQATSLNGIPLDDYLNSIVTKSSTGSPILGVKSFNGEVNIGSLNVVHINEKNIAEWIQNVLHRYRNQTISNTWTFDTIKTQQVWAPMINNLDTQHLIDMNTPAIEIESDLMVENLDVDKNTVTTQTNCDIAAVTNVISQGIRKTKWKFIDVEGLATWPGDDVTTPINRLLSFAVIDSVNQIVTGNVSFAQSTQINYYSGDISINNVDLVRISNDALLTSSGFQQISAHKVFRNRLKTRAVSSGLNLDILTYNQCDLVALNRTLFRAGVDNTLTGTKIFRVSPIAENIYIEGLIRGVAISDIVTINSTQILPPVVFQADIIVNNKLHITDSLNYIPFNFFIQNRLRLFGPIQEIQGTLTFEHLVLKGNTRLVTINDIPMADIVIRSSDVVQEIVGRKRIVGKLNLDGPVVVTHINNVDLVQAFLKTIWIDQNAHLQRLKVHNNITLRNGIVIQESLLGVDLMSVLYWQSPSSQDLKPIQTEIVKQINQIEVMLQQHQSNMSDVYLDYAANVKIKYAKYPNEETFIVDTTVPCEVMCQCPVQNFVSIAQYQVYVHRQPIFERVIRLKGRNTNLTVITTFEDTAECKMYISTNHTSNTIINWFDSEGFVHNESVSYTPIRKSLLFEQGNVSIILLAHLNKSVDFWQLNPEGNALYKSTTLLSDGRPIDQMFILNWMNYNILLITYEPAQGAVHGTVQMFTFNGTAFAKTFETISGDYNQCAWMQMKRYDEFMVWLGRSGSNVISVFKAMSHNGVLGGFELSQSIIIPDGTVKTIVSITIQDINYVAVVTQNSFLHLYKFNFLEGWVRATFGYFKDIETVVPFQYYQRNYLYVSMKLAATALIIHQRG